MDFWHEGKLSMILPKQPLPMLVDTGIGGGGVPVLPGLMGQDMLQARVEGPVKGK